MHLVKEQVPLFSFVFFLWLSYHVKYKFFFFSLTVLYSPNGMYKSESFNGQHSKTCRLVVRAAHPYVIY